MQPATPYLAVDLDVLDRNLAGMARLAADRELRLRPHAKTHKSPDLAARQVAAGAVGLTVATVAEAEVFASAGFTDLFLAYPLWVDEAKARRLRRLLELATLTIGVDSAESARTLSGRLGGAAASVAVLLEVDSGHHRTGVPSARAGELAEQVAATGLEVSGVFTFPGHGYTPGQQQVVVEQESRSLQDAARSMAAAGIPARVLSGGSTPTAGLVTAGSMTELRPGVYAFGDAQQLELGSIAGDAVALTAVGTVVSHAAGHVVLDTGSKVLGADRPGWASGFGRLLDHPEARIPSLSEHHAVVSWDHSPRPPLGSRLRVVPNHVCNAVNLADELVVVQAGAVVDRWPVAARGANT